MGSVYTLPEIRNSLRQGKLPLSGVTELGSTEFHILEPAHYAGVVMHAGHRVRPEILKILAVRKEDRLREEDPLMERFISGFPIQVIARDSRFEYDVNWEAEKAIYEYGQKKWGLQVWKREPSADMRDRSLLKFHEFHALIDLVTEFMLRQNRYALVFDVHSFCYQREAKQSWFKDKKPDVNLGTRAVNRELFAPLIDRLMKCLGRTRIDGHLLRVAENELFPGGYLSRKLSRDHYDKVLVLALEYKKLFMNELSGELYKDLLEELIRSFTCIVKDIISIDYLPKDI